jgi:hypothetical protein
MRIYVLSNNVVKKKIALLEPYLQETRQICYIWSVNGLLQIENNKIYKIKIKDVPTKKTLLGAFPATIDESEFIRKEECYQILPIAHKEYTTLKIYRVKGSTLTNPAPNPSTNLSENQTPNPSQNPSTNHSETPTASGIALEWVLEYKNGELHDNYFSLPVNEDIHSLKHKADLSEFMNI